MRSTSAASMPPQSPKIALEYAAPYDCEPRGLPYATAIPCAASTWNSRKNVLPYAPCGPPCTSSTSGSFDSFALGGAISHASSIVPSVARGR